MNEPNRELDCGGHISRCRWTAADATPGWQTLRWVTSRIFRRPYMRDEVMCLRTGEFGGEYALPGASVYASAIPGSPL